MLSYELPMLNFHLVKSQINEMVKNRKGFIDEFAEKLRIAQSELASKSAGWEELSEKVRLSKTSWLVAGISSSLIEKHPLPKRPSSYTAISSDGSQIFPDRHESLPCYLINISDVVLSYGDNSEAKLDSNPSLYYKDEDRFTMWDGKRIAAGVDIISLKRSLMEFERILELLKHRDSGLDHTIALSDGTLIMWHLEGMPADFKESIMVPFFQLMDEFKALGVPIAGYISLPGSTDVINALRVGLCPEKVSYCNQCPYTQLPKLPCAPIEGLTDRNLFAGILKPGERSAVFESSSKILDIYGDHHVYFYYVNIGEEISRVEIPKWVALDDGLLSNAHTLIYDQAKKGGGYPIAIAEAHEQAVVKGRDRDFFYDLVREVFVKSKMKVTVSRKGLSKRIPGV